jgi:hypothetical protein
MGAGTCVQGIVRWGGMEKGDQLGDTNNINLRAASFF